MGDCRHLTVKRALLFSVEPISAWPGRDPSDRGPDPAALLEAPDAGSLSHPRGRSGWLDRIQRRSRASEERCRASRRGEDPGAGPGDLARGPESVTGSFRPCRDAEDPERALGRLRLVCGRLSRSGGQAPKWRSKRRLSAWELPAPSTVRSGLSPFREHGLHRCSSRTGAVHRSVDEVCLVGRPQRKPGPVRPAGWRGGEHETPSGEPESALKSRIEAPVAD